MVLTIHDKCKGISYFTFHAVTEEAFKIISGILLYDGLEVTCLRFKIKL